MLMPLPDAVGTHSRNLVRARSLLHTMPSESTGDICISITAAAESRYASATRTGET